MGHRFKLLMLTLAFLFVAATSRAWAAPVSVSFTTSGTSGNYILDFSVTNNMLAWPSQGIYFFGVSLSARDIVGSPGFFNPNSWITWSNVPYGGSSTVYNNNWIGGPAILPGNTLSGFQVHITDLVAPTTVPWFAFSAANFFTPADYYTGPGAFYYGGGGYNPGFEGGGLAATAVPEPASLSLLGACTLVGGFFVRRRQTVFHAAR